MRKEIDIYEHLNEILKRLKKGVLLTTKNGNEVNTMTISWGKIGIEWNKLIFTAYIREGRHTFKMLESGEFTINIPIDEKAGKILGFCGTKSGKNTDKIKEMNLTLVEGKNVGAPAIKELPLTLECKVIYKQKQDENAITEEFKKVFYPQNVPSDNPAGNKDFHVMFYGEIVAAYILE